MIKEINKILKDNSYETTDDYNEDVCLINVTSEQERTEISGRIVKKLMLCGTMDWVSVEDNLPPKYENVIIRNENNIVSTDQISDAGWSYAEISCLKVTHWMHLPKPPCA